jgi:hypothetical protein
VSRTLGMNPDEVRTTLNRVRALAGGLQTIENKVWKARAMSLNPWNYALDPGSLILAPYSIVVAASASGDIASVRNSLAFLLGKLDHEITQQVLVSQTLSSKDYGWDYSFNPPQSQGDYNNDTNPWELGWQWLTGQGPRHNYFTDGDPFTELVREHEHWEDLRDYIRDAINDPATTREDGFLYSGEGQWDYQLGGPDGAYKFIRDYTTIATGGLTGNLAMAYLGSQEVTFKVLSVNDDGTVTVLFRSENESTISSATHPPVIGYTDWWRDNVETPLDKWAESLGGPIGTTTQTVEWTETFKLNP